MNKITVISFGLICCISLSLSSNCNSIEGNWYNQLGSELILTKNQESIVGEFRTAVEKAHGTAGSSHSLAKGLDLKQDSGNAVAFTVVFNGGQSATSWIGQCKKCGGEEILKTSWILKTYQGTCLDHWKSVLINEDVFTRTPQRDGPRRHLGIHTPKRSQKLFTEDEESTDNSVTRFNEADFKGKWYTTDGIELDLKIETSRGVVNGTFAGKDGKASPLFGHFEPGRADAVFGLYAAVPENSAVRICVGQYHRCDEGNEVLETSWLQSKTSVGCERTFDDVNFIKKTFYRTPPSNNVQDSNPSVYSKIKNAVSSAWSRMFGQ